MKKGRRRVAPAGVGGRGLRHCMYLILGQIILFGKGPTRIAEPFKWPL